MNPRFEVPGPEASTKPAPVDPALDNVSWAWLESVRRVGFEVLATVIPYSDELWAHEDLSAELDRDLRAAGLGRLDSTSWGNPMTHFFYVPRLELQAAAEFMEAALAKAGVLAGCKLAHADNADHVWRIIYPRAAETTNPTA